MLNLLSVSFADTLTSTGFEPKSLLFSSNLFSPDLITNPFYKPFTFSFNFWANANAGRLWAVVKMKFLLFIVDLF